MAGGVADAETDRVLGRVGERRVVGGTVAVGLGFDTWRDDGGDVGACLRGVGLVRGFRGAGGFLLELGGVLLVRDACG